MLQNKKEAHMPYSFAEGATSSRGNERRMPNNKDDETGENVRQDDEPKQRRPNQTDRGSYDKRDGS
jgi:hypothetical protein